MNMSKTSSRLSPFSAILENKEQKRLDYYCLSYAETFEQLNLFAGTKNV